MFQRFAAGTAIASIAVAIAAIILSLTPGPKFERIYPLTILWCCAPLAWGVWALLTPSAWMPKRLPLWGAFLGLFAGSMAAFVLNLPSRFLGEPVSMLVRAIAVLVMTLFYYLMWMLVRGAYRWLAGTTSA
jgi:drug/metabolite transporter (DMT)-like permease